MLILSMIAASAAPLAHQGRLVDALGQPIDGTTALTVTLHDAGTGGNVLWTEASSVPVLDGYYTMLVGDTSEAFDAVFDTSEVWLQVTGPTGPLGDRQPLHGVPYAVRAVEASRLPDDPTLTGTVTIDGGTVTGLDAPTLDADAATKAYVDEHSADVNDLLWWASANLEHGTFTDQQGNTETFTTPGSNGVACSSGNSVCIQNHGGSYFTISFLVPTTQVDAQQNAPGGGVVGNLMCWATGSGDNEPGHRTYGTTVTSYAGDINGGHDHCNTTGVSAFESAGGTTCLGLRTSSAYSASDTSYGVVCVK